MSEEQKVNGAEPEAAEACGVCLPPWRMPNPLPPSRGTLIGAQYTAFEGALRRDPWISRRQCLSH
eukprot:scaffold48_cov311-Pinguiococcus_pyrenoidosus.AAC.250